jgi:cell division protein FtsI/penicillin-binding protein 2
MITKLINKNKIKYINSFVDPDEIFLDSQNLQNFDRQQFEGRIEKTISKSTIILLGSLFFVVVAIFTSRLFYLQINKGEAYFKRSQNNILEKAIIFTDRGIIYDRNKVELAWNKKTDEASVPTRTYLSPGFSHLLGYVSYPTQDKGGNFLLEQPLKKNLNYRQ